MMIFPKAKCIFVRRRDLIEQAISLAKAWSSGSYISSVQGKEAIYNKREIKNAYELIVRGNSCWEFFIARRDVKYITVYYEDFVVSKEAILNKEIVTGKSQRQMLFLFFSIP